MAATLVENESRARSRESLDLSCLIEMTEDITRIHKLSNGNFVLPNLASRCRKPFYGFESKHVRLSYKAGGPSV